MRAHLYWWLAAAQPALNIRVAPGPDISAHIQGKSLQELSAIILCDMAIPQCCRWPMVRSSSLSSAQCTGVSP